MTKAQKANDKNQNKTKKKQETNRNQNKNQKKDNTAIEKFTIQDYEFIIEHTDWHKRCQAENLFHIIKKDQKVSFLCNVTVEEKINKDYGFSLYINYSEPSFTVGRVVTTKKDKHSEREILIERSIDKAIRPLLSQMQNKVIAIDIKLINYSPMDLESLAGLCSILCLKKVYPLDIAFGKIAIDDEKFVIFPDLYAQNKYKTIITASFNENNIYFLDVESNEISEEKLAKHIKALPDIFNEYFSYLRNVKSENQFPKFASKIIDKIEDINMKFDPEEEYESKRTAVSAFLSNKKHRLNNRKTEEIREIKITKGPIEKIPNVVFARGKTVVLSMVNNLNDRINIGETIKEEQNIVCSYSFPGYCTGQTSDKKLSKREFGHSDLIRSAFQKIIDQNIKIDSKVLSSDGSSSMASVCSASGALLLSGITDKIVGGISIGYFKGKKPMFIVDMDEEEDQISDMDFKITRTKEGITAIRADFKSYLEISYLEQVLSVAKKANLSIIEKIEACNFKSTQKSIELTIDKSKLGLFIGGNGKTVKELSDKTKCRIQTKQDGTVTVTGENTELFQKLALPFQREITEKEEFITILKEDVDGKLGNSIIGKLKFTKNFKANRGSLVVCKLKNITDDIREVSIKLFQ